MRSSRYRLHPIMLAAILGLACGGDGGQGPSGRGTISGMITLSTLPLAPPAAKQRGSGLSLHLSRIDRKQTGINAAAIFQSLPARKTRTPRFGVPNELVVTYRATALAAPQLGSRALATRAGAEAAGVLIRTRVHSALIGRRAHLVGVSPAILAARIRIEDPGDVDGLLRDLRSSPEVATVEPNGLVSRTDRRFTRLVTSPNDQLYPFQSWHYRMIDLPRAWDVTRGSAAVLVAVVDDGTRLDHPDVAPNLTADGRDFVSDVSIPVCAGGTMSIAGDGDGYDANPVTPAAYRVDPLEDCVTGPEQYGAHGLHVAGTIGAKGNDGAGVTGVNWTVRIRPVRVLGVTGSGTEYDIAQGLLYAAGLPADNGAGGMVQAASAARVINMSLGGPDDPTVLENAVIAATNAGALIVAAAGNDPTSTPNYPAAYPQVLSVSAVGPDREIASYSSFGSTVDLAAPGGDQADGANPSWGVLSAGWDFSTQQPVHLFGDGTSMAAPHVAGVAALLLAQNPALSNSQLRSRLMDHAVDAGIPGRDDFYGAGLINARNALTQSSSATASLYARLYNATTGAAVQTVPADQTSSYSFRSVANGQYFVFAGQDEATDMGVGLPGRRWGAHGGSANPSMIGVTGTTTFTASFTIGLPTEVEPNDEPASGDILVVGGYLNGTISDPDTDIDLVKVQIPSAGQYTFETHAENGACGLALDEDTVLGLLDSGQNLLVENDDIDFDNFRWCSRIVRSLDAGTYYLGIIGYNGGPYQVSARAGS